ncbi:uncharacterized protein LOC120280203 [Dioscorea cayenensis subsp. rotundata]|uniref:Uncharacterized protein LOC120280203 n=1 Tax=Dioscorea cayennensis subsp. rotundata TaxID=55577 RepID=A0AB40CVS8_DIOCR|nr:uncharacterized protein LOC120280203 [Dioscorea cayenensis subsp. rotundata]
MEAVRSMATSVIGNKDRVVSLFLVGAFAVLGFRSAAQQRQIETLEDEKESLRSGNKAMSTTMWEWRQSLFALAESDPLSFPIPLARLRSIYSEEDRRQAFSSPPSDIDSGTGEVTAQSSVRLE